MTRRRVFKGWSLFFAGFGILVSSCVAHAFDPLTVAAVASAAAGTVNSITDAASEVSASASAFSDLYGEIDSEAVVSEDGQRIVNKIQETENLAREVGYTKEEIEALGGDRQKVKKLSELMHKMARAIRTGKRVARLVGKLEKKAQLAQVEGTDIQREQLAVEYLMYRQAYEMELDKKIAALKKKLEEDKYLKDRKKEIEARGGRKWGKWAIYTFPNLNSTLKATLEVAISIRGYLLSLLLALFMLRVIYLEIKLSGEADYGRLLQDAVLCAFWLAVFPSVVNLIADVSGSLADKIAVLNNVPRPEFTAAPTGSSMSAIIDKISWFITMIPVIIFKTADVMFNVGTSVVILAFPIIIIASRMLNLSPGIATTVSILLSLMLWPFLWNGLGAITLKVWHQKEVLARDCLEATIISAVQFVSPFFAQKMLHGTAGAVITQSLMHHAHQGAKAVPGHAQGVINGIRGSKEGKGSVIGKTLGGMAGYLPAQGMQRIFAAVQRGKTEFDKGRADNSKNNVTSIASQAARGAIMNNARSANSNVTGLKKGIQTGSRFIDGLKPQRRVFGPGAQEKEANV